MHIEDFLPSLWRADWSVVRNIRVSSWIALAFFVLFFSPFILDALAIGTALAVLIPLALMFGLIEHWAPPLWLLVLLFIHICGLADLTTDCILLGKMVKFYFTNEVDDDEKFEDDDERNLFIARVLMTLIGSLPVILFFMFGQKLVQGAMCDIGQWEKSSSSSSSSLTNSGSGIAIVLMALVWKGVMVLLRVFLLYRVSRDIVTEGRVRKESHATIEFLELLLLVDLLWSGIPLGVLTFVELFIYSHEGFQGNQDQIFEVIKLSAVLIDAVAASYLIYFTFFRLKKVIFKHKDHDDHAPATINEHDDDKKLIEDEESKLLSTKVDPYLPNPSSLGRNAKPNLP